MLREAEEFAEQDKVAKERIDAKNSLESYVYSMKNQIEDTEKLASKLNDDDKEKIQDALKDTQEWLSKNPNAEKEEFDEELKELQAVCNPIVSKIYEKTGGQKEQEGSHDDYDTDL